MSDYYEDDSPLEVDYQSKPEATPEEGESPYRATSNDPAFGFLLAVAVSIGLIPTLPDYADLRYTLTWGALAVVGVLAWLLGNTERIEQEKPDNIVWGVGFALMVSVPFALFFFEIFGRASALIFPTMGLGTVLGYLVFVMPLAETLFFRALLQARMEFYIVGALSGLWSILLFFPVMWGEILEAPAVALFLAIALFVLNMLYSYVKERNGLAAAWICQIVASVILLFIPTL